MIRMEIIHDTTVEVELKLKLKLKGKSKFGIRLVMFSQNLSIWLLLEK